MWHIINPELRPSVTRREVYSVINRIAYVAVNLNQKLLNNLPDGEMRGKALDYHKRIASTRKSFLSKVGSSLPEQITQEDLGGDILHQFYRSYDLRMAIAGDTMA